MESKAHSDAVSSNTCLVLLLLLSWACYVMGWEGGVYSQEDGTQVLQQGDLVWV